jgi:hypothetical protein
MQKSLKFLCFFMCIEDYHKMTQTQFLIQSPLGNLTSVLTEERRLLKVTSHDERAF